MSRDFLEGFAPVSTVLPVRKELPVWKELPVREHWGYIRPGAGSESPFRDRPVTGSHLFGSVVYLSCGSRSYCWDFGRGH